MKNSEINSVNRKKVLNILSIVLIITIVVVIVILMINFNRRNKESNTVISEKDAMKLVKTNFNLTDEEMTTTEGDNYFFVTVQGNEKRLFTVKKDDGTVRQREINTGTSEVLASEAG